MQVALWLAQIPPGVVAPPDLAAELAPWGVLTAALSLFTLMWRSTVHAHEKRADDWRAAAELAGARADELQRQVWSVVSAVRDRASS